MKITCKYINVYFTRKDEKSGDTYISKNLTKSCRSQNRRIREIMLSLSCSTCDKPQDDV